MIAVAVLAGLLFKSDRGGIETIIMKLTYLIHVSFKSDRGGIETSTYSNPAQPYSQEFKSDRGGIETHDRTERLKWLKQVQIRPWRD